LRCLALSASEPDPLNGSQKIEHQIYSSAIEPRPARDIVAPPIHSVTNEAWRARAAWKMEAWRKRAEQHRVENPDEYKRILGLATDEGGRLAGRS
jgi:hypothetical protein